MESHVRAHTHTRDAPDPLFKILLPVFHHTPPQALLAIGLLGLRPWKPRTVGAIGMAASALNCYFLYPAVARVAAPASAGAGAPAPASGPVAAATAAAAAARRAVEAGVGALGGGVGARELKAA